MYVVASTALSGIVPEVPPWAFSIVFVVANTFVNIRGIALTDIVNRIALVLEAVSYTHLDVYKRQLHGLSSC